MLSQPAFSLSAYLHARLNGRINRLLPRHLFERRRLRRFRRFAAFARARSPFYRDIMAERGIDPRRCRPEDFPVLSKQEVMQNFDRIVTAPNVRRADIEEFLHRNRDVKTLFRDRYMVAHTSGTSGVLGIFVFDAKAWSRGFGQVPNTREHMRRRGGRRRVAFVGCTGGHYAGPGFFATLARPPLDRLFDLRLIEINAPLAAIVAQLNEFAPDQLGSYGSMLRLLAERKLAGELTIAPSILTVGAEPLLPGDREVAERAFGVGVQIYYAASEHMMMGFKAPGSETMRLFEDELIFEIQPDHICVTNLFNRTLPLIRYRMEDVLVPGDDDEHRPYRGVAELVGRSENAPIFRNRHGEPDWISPHTINQILLPRVRRFQLRVHGAESFTFAMVLEPGTDAAAERDTLSAAEACWSDLLAAKEMENVTCRIILVDDLPLDPQTGKFRLILQDAAAAAGVGREAAAATGPAGVP